MVNTAFTIFGQAERMAASPVSGPSPTQLAALEQIRALRAAKPVAVAAPAAAPAPAKPAASLTIDNTKATLSAANPPPANRPRGSILNITA